MILRTMHTQTLRLSPLKFPIKIITKLRCAYKSNHHHRPLMSINWIAPTHHRPSRHSLGRLRPPSQLRILYQPSPFFSPLTFFPSIISLLHTSWLFACSVVDAINVYYISLSSPDTSLCSLHSLHSTSSTVFILPSNS